MKTKKKSDPLTQRREVLSRLAQAGRWYTIKNQAGPVAELLIFDEIWFLGVNAEDFARDLQAITAPEILVRVNSPGGDVFDAIAIYNSLRAHPATVTVRVEGIAASAASVIVQAADKRVMMGGSQMMIHEPWGMAVGPASEIREFADLLDRQTDVLAGIYAARSEKDAEHFRTLMAGSSDVWFTAEEAVAEGLADEISDPKPEQQDAPAPQNKRLADEVKAAVDAVAVVIEGAERVVALRAEKGKPLSRVNAESLDGLREQLKRLEALLAAPETEDDEEAVRAELQREHLRFLALTA